MNGSGGGSGLSVTRNATWLAVGRVAGQLLSVVLTIVLARGLGTTGFGQYAFVGAIIMIANVFTTFGTDGLLIREIASGREDPGRLATRAVALQLLLSIAFVIVIAAGAGWLPGRSPDTVAALRIYALSLFPLAFYGVFTAALRGWERMDLYAQLTIGTAALQTGAALAAVHVGASLPRVMVALTVAQLGAAVLGWRLCRVARPAVALLVWEARAPLGPVVQRSWLLALVTGLGMLSERVGVVLLSSLAGDASAGWFAAAARVVEGLKLANSSVSGAMFPVASRLTALEAFDGSVVARRSLTQLLRGSRIVLLAIAVLAAVSATLLAAPIVTFLYGRAYGPAVAALRVLSWTLIPAAASAPVSLALVSAGLERIAVLAGALAVAVITGLGVWLIPRAGVNGACVAVLAGEVVRALVFLTAARRRFTPRFAPHAVT